MAADRRREREEKRRGRKERKKEKREKEERRERSGREGEEREEEKKISSARVFRRSKPDYIAFGFFVKTREVTDLPL